MLKKLFLSALFICLCSPSFAINYEAIKESAQKGDVYAQYDLGLMYSSGDGVKQDYKEAFKWWRKAAEQGYAEAQYNLALCYDNGEGVSKSKTEAVRWYRKAAEQGEVHAQWNLARKYYFGEGVRSNKDLSVKRQNRAEAERWLKKTVSNDDAKTQYVNDYAKAQYVLSTRYVDANNIIHFRAWE